MINPRKEVLAEGVELWCGDCREVLPTLGKFDLCLTDPPFGVGNFVQTTGKIRGRGKNKGVKVDWNNSAPDETLFEIIRSMTTHRIIWGANFFNCFEDRGGAIIWDKCQKMPNFSKADIASCTHFQKTEIVRIPWTNFTSAHKAETDHPCERPVELYSWCLEYLPNKPRTCLEPFMGSGSVVVACIKSGVHVTAIEREPKYFDMACRRISDALKSPDLFIQAPAPKAKQEFLL